MYKVRLIIAAIILVCNFQIWGNKPAKVMESFEQGIPKGLVANGGKISIDTKRMKHGQQSLKWEWSGNSQIIFNSPVGYHEQKIISGENLDKNNGHGGSETNPVLEPPRGFFLWVYNEKASKQRLRIQFGRDDKVDCEFDFNLNFKGWRTISIAYDRGDLRGVPREDMNRMTINAPNTGSGTFFLDMLGMSVTMNPRTVGANPQLPEIDQHPRLVSSYPHILFAYSKQTPTFQLKPLTNDLVSDFRTIEKQISDVYWPDYKKADYTEGEFKNVRAQYDKFEIVREGDKIYGRPLVYQHIINDHFGELNLPKDKKFEGLMIWRNDFNYALKAISEMHHFTDNEELKLELEHMFINLFDYGVDQGFDYGAGLGWIHHYSYNIREYGPAMFLMRDVLKKHNRLKKAHEICRWFYSFNQVYDEKVVYNYEGRTGGNADEMQGLLMPRLITAFLQDDSPEKARDLEHFSSYYSNVVTNYAQALDETFKPDGTVFHHAGHSFGYGGRAINGAACTMYMLSGTNFAASEQAYKRVKKVLTAYFQQMFTDKVMAPKAFASIRFGNYELPNQFYQMPGILALSAQTFDEELAGLFDDALTKFDKTAKDHSYWKEKVEAARSRNEKYNYTRCEIYPYTCVGTNRKANDFLITARGHSKFVYPFESWGKSFFAYPLFIANGYLDVSYPNSLDALTPGEGIWHKGYDWHRWPGVTAVNLPYDKMLTDPGQVRDEGGEYLFSDQAFCGGVSSTYGCGVFAFQFKGHDKFNLQGFSGKKTYFFIDDKVVCLGSNINSDLDYDVETTLFQSALKATDEATIMNAKGNIVAFPYSEKLSAKKPVWLIDSRNTGYYVNAIDEHAEIALTRSTQTNPDKHNEGEVSGNFATAIINHGKKPNGASYSYILMANADKQKMNALAVDMNAKQKPIQVLQQDNQAHVVALTEVNATAYAVYAKDGAEFKKGIVKKVNKQATLIVKEENDKVVLSVADPDLNIYDGQDDLLPDGSRCELSVYEREWFFWPSRSTKVKLTLKGKWDIEKQLKEIETVEFKRAKIISSNKKETVIEFECRDGLSAEVLLSK